MDKDTAVLIIHALINQLGARTERDQGTDMVGERETAEREEKKKLTDRGSIKETETWAAGEGPRNTSQRGFLCTVIHEQ